MRLQHEFNNQTCSYSDACAVLRTNVLNNLFLRLYQPQTSAIAADQDFIVNQHRVSDVWEVTEQPTVHTQPVSHARVAARFCETKRVPFTVQRGLPDLVRKCWVHLCDRRLEGISNYSSTQLLAQFTSYAHEQSWSSFSLIKQSRHEIWNKRGAWWPGDAGSPQWSTNAPQKTSIAADYKMICIIWRIRLNNLYLHRSQFR